MKNNDYGTATKRQRWAIFTLSHQDYREKYLSKESASDLIKGLIELKGLTHLD